MTNEQQAQLVSNCCRAYPRLEVNGVEWNDEDNGICPTCGDRCEYVEEDREADAYEAEMHRRNWEYQKQARDFYGLDTITYDDGTIELIDRGIIQPNIDKGVITEREVLEAE